MILDSSALIAYFRKRDVFHDISIEMIEKFEFLIVPDYILAESLTVLKIKEGFSTAAECAQFLSNSENISIRKTHSEEFEATLKYFQKNENTLSFVDCLLVILAKKEKESVMSFDKTLQSALKNG